MSESWNQPGCRCQGGRAVHIVEHGGWIRPRRGTRARNRLQYFLSHLLGDGVEFTGLHPAFDEMALHSLDRTFFLDGCEFLLGAVMLSIADEMAGHAVCHAFQKKGTRTAAQRRDGFAG